MDLIVKDVFKDLPVQYQSMLNRISESYPIIHKATKNFNKSQSQFMDNMFTISQPTELRSARQILAEIAKAKMAMDEAYFSIRKKQIQIKRKRQEQDELSEIEAQEMESQIAVTMEYVEGAVRKISAYMTQYQNILNKYGKSEFTEEDFERDEERYHIMTAFTQALYAAMAHNGIIDEGNQIYMGQIGISVFAAQAEVSDFLNIGQDLIAKGKMPTHAMVLKWLNALADKYAGCASQYAEYKGMTLMDNKSLIGQNENIRN